MLTFISSSCLIEVTSLTRLTVCDVKTDFSVILWNLPKVIAVIHLSHKCPNFCCRLWVYCWPCIWGLRNIDVSRSLASNLNFPNSKSSQFSILGWQTWCTWNTSILPEQLMMMSTCKYCNRTLPEIKLWEKALVHHSA